MFRSTLNSPNNPIQGALLRSLENGREISIPALRALSPLTDKAQVVVDKTVRSVGLARLVVAGDMLAAGMTLKLDDPLSVTQLEWNYNSKVGGAQRTMSPRARGENQLPDVILNRLPIYLTTDDFNVDIRTLKMSQRVGQPLDTNLITQATRRVNEAIEDSVINGSGPVVGGYSAPGLVNAPNANTLTITTGWDASTPATGAAVFADVMAMIAKLQADHYYGPFNLYVGTTVGNALMADYSTVKGDGTSWERLRRIVAGNGASLTIKVADQMPAKTVILMQMTEDVFRLIDGLRPTVIPWTSNDGFTLFWLVMAIIVPQAFTDYEGQSGICVGTWA